MNDSLSSITRGHVIAVAISILLSIYPLMETNSFKINLDTTSSVNSLWVEMHHDYIREDVTPWDIVFKNMTHGWVLSQSETGLRNGIVLFTNNSGSSWYLQELIETSWFFRIEIVGDVLWVSGVGGLYKSVDEGRSWEYIAVGVDIESFNGIFFLNETVGWTGSLLGIYKTVDRGSSWNKLTIGSFGDTPREFHFLNELEGWTIGSFGIYHTSDGGETWETVHEKGGWTFSFLSPTEAWAVGDNMLAHMVDGANWIEQPLPSNEYGRPPYMTDVQFLNGTQGWIGALNPQIAHTQNGGLDWYEQSISGNDRIYALWFYNETHGWATGRDGRIYRTTRANERGEYSWSTVNVALVYGVSFVLIAAVVISIVFVRFRKKPSVISSAPAIE